MSEVIVKIMDSLNRYEIMTQLVSGIFLYILLEKCAHIVLPSSGGFDIFVACWLCGFVSGRVGGVVVEPIMKTLGSCHKYLGPVFASREVYAEFRASHEMWCKTLLADANLYRTLFAGGILIVVARCVTAIQSDVTGWTNGDSVLVAWCILFCASYWRQVDLLRKNAEESVKKK